MEKSLTDWHFDIGRDGKNRVLISPQLASQLLNNTVEQFSLLI
jgi:hypothetical protein